MRTVLNAKQMKEVDGYMINTMGIPSLLLMENAAMGVCNIIMEQIEPCCVHVFCGTGNNGGDGLAAARILLSHGYDVYVIVAGNIGEMSEETASNFRIFQNMENRAKCIASASELEDWGIPEPDAVVDAIFGTGLSRDVGGVQKELIEYINSIDDIVVVSVDIPSGVNTDTGEVMGEAVWASVTAALQYPKPCHYLFPGREYAGEVEVVRIGIDEGCEAVHQSNICVYESGDEDICLGKRAVDSNKGDYGRLLIVAGSRGMAGAAVLCARAASRAGAGLVTVGAPEEVTRVVQQSVPEAICSVLTDEEGSLVRHSIFDIARLVKGKTAIAVGPGLGTGVDIQEIISSLITDYEITKVIDADGLNALAGNLDVLRNRSGEVVLTPHPKEFARLIESDVETVLHDAINIVPAFAVKFGVTLVLKGATTMIADKNGRVCLLCAGTPGMAKGGSGDVLTGVIAGFAAQGKGAFESALIGAYVAASAGEMAVEEMGEYSMTPMDTVNYLGIAIQEIISDHVEADKVNKSYPGIKTIEQVEILERYIPDIYAHEEPKAQETAPESTVPRMEENIVPPIRQEEPRIQPVRREEPVLEDFIPSEKTAEDALAEIEEKEQTREIKKVTLEDLKNGNNGNGGGDTPDGPTRRRIG